GRRRSSRCRPPRCRRRLRDRRPRRVRRRPPAEAASRGGAITMWITRVSITNPVFATMVMIGIAVLGIFSYNRLRVEQMPDVTLPFVLVLTADPGANPEVVETD